MIGAEEIGALDGAMYNPMAYYSLEHADNLNTEPTNKNRVSEIKISASLCY